MIFLPLIYLLSFRNSFELYIICVKMEVASHQQSRFNQQRILNIERAHVLFLFSFSSQSLIVFILLI